MSTQAYSYLELEKLITPITHLKHLLSLAKWDKATMLASGSAASRQREIASATTIAHKMTADSKLRDYINSAIINEDALDEWQKANLNLIKKAYEEAVCIPSHLKEEYSIVTGTCEFTWRTARKNNDFKLLLPHLDRVFALASHIGELKVSYFFGKSYDKLLDVYNPDFTSESIKAVYAVLKEELPDLIQTIVERQATEKVIPLTEKIDEATQKALNLKIIEKMGFSLAHGRLDKSAHPFCDGSNDDVRLTTRYEEDNFLSALTSTMHEAGHGLYQQNLPKAYRDQPVGSFKGLTFHESQSIIMERQAGISMPFMEFLATLLRDEFGFKGAAYTAENLYKLLTRVKPSLIRVDADEVTYPLHVILRFEIEEAIIEGKVATKDLPALWNEKMKDYLGITPDKDANGCMQDIHWHMGAIGYFPAYTNGAIIASMLMKAAREKHPSIDKELGAGSFQSLNDYLNTHLRQFGSMKTSADLLKGATGYTEVQPTIFVDYLKKKYLG